MGHYQYEIAGTAALLSRVRDALLAEGWTVLVNCATDKAIDGSGAADGIRLVVCSPDGKLFASLRSAAGRPIFNTQLHEGNAYGVGLVCHDAFDGTAQMWYDQPNAPVVYDTDEVIGVGIPMGSSSTGRLYVNVLNNPYMVLISLQIRGIFQHLVFGQVEKSGDWEGGTIFSGSRNSYRMFTQSAIVDPDALELESLPLFGMSEEAATFLRIDIDGAPIRKPSEFWAHSGSTDFKVNHCCTGTKQLALPIHAKNLEQALWLPQVPDYRHFQSQGMFDPGRAMNTASCILEGEPITTYVLVDPDELKNYAMAGKVPGIHAVSLKTAAPGDVVPVGYPEANKESHQVFPHTRRGGIYGYDGISIKR